MKKIVFGVLALLLSVACAQADASAENSKDDKSPTANETVSSSLEERGNQLRKAIAEAYKAHPINIHSGNDITSTVTSFIPPGISFDDAEKILQSAGFTVGSRPGLQKNVKAGAPRIGDNEKFRWDVVASIDPYPTPFFWGKVSIYVNLTPQSSRDYSKVSTVHAVIGISYL